MLKKTLVLLVLCSAVVFAEHNEVVIRQKRGTYQLNFNTTYVTYVNLDIELMITLPQAYKFVAAIPGSKDFIHASPIQNTMYVTKTSEGSFQTNLAMHVVTPEGIEEKLIFRLIAKRKTPKVLAIHFTGPNSSGLNRTVEKIKARYKQQLDQALSEQETELDKVIHEEIVCRGMAWFVNRKRGRLRLSYKGAHIDFYGMYNSRSETYLYIKSSIHKDECEIIQLEKAGVRKSLMEAEFVCSYEDEDGAWIYVYKIPQIRLKVKNKRILVQKFRIIYRIWSKRVKQKFRIS